LQKLPDEGLRGLLSGSAQPTDARNCPLLRPSGTGRDDGAPGYGRDECSA
jgi:hypothetical protein